MSLNPLWRPAEDETTIINEQTWLAGTLLAAVAYGMVFCLFVLTLPQLIKTTTRDNYTQRRLLIIYITLLFILGTLYIGSVAQLTEFGFIDYRLFPGGPGFLPFNLALKTLCTDDYHNIAAFEDLDFSLPISHMANISIVIGSWLFHGLMVRMDSIPISMQNFLNLSNRFTGTWLFSGILITSPFGWSC
jgi:hypothetical protein